MPTSSLQLQTCLPKMVSRLLDLGVETWCRRDVAGYTPSFQGIIKLCEVSLTLNRAQLVPTILHAAFEPGLRTSDTILSKLSNISALLRTYGHPELLEDGRISSIIQRSVESWIKETIGTVRPSGTLWNKHGSCNKGCPECRQVIDHLIDIQYLYRRSDLKISSFQKGRFRHVQGWLEKLSLARYATWTASVSAPKSITVSPTVQRGEAYVDNMTLSVDDRSH